MARLLEGDGDRVAVPGVVRTEVLSGARTEADARKLKRMLSFCPTAPLEDPQDYESAGVLRRAVRLNGHTVSVTDCLIAWAAIRDDLELLHNDSDFELIAEVSPLRLADLGG
jgi:predicted nucleic acid-binding protein